MGEKKTDLREYSEAELSLWVLNDEGLYKMRRCILKDIESNRPSILSDLFEYTEDQLEELKKDLIEDLEGER